jgi:hypothetical protein
VDAAQPGVASARALLDAADAWKQVGHLADARLGFAEAAAVAQRTGDSAALVLAALGLGGIWVHEQRDVVALAQVHAVWQQARAAVPPSSLAEARLMVRESAEAVYEAASADDAVVAAVERVRRFGDHAATAEALSLLHHVQLGPHHAQHRLCLAEEMIGLAVQAGDVVTILMGLCWRTVDLFLLGDSRAGQSLEELRQRSAAAKCEAIAFVADILGAMVLARTGAFDRAEAAATAALERGTIAGDLDAPAYYGAMLAALRWWQGRGAEVLGVVRTISTSPRLGPNDHVYVAADALLSATQGDVDSAEEALARLTGIGLGQLPRSSSWTATQFLVAEAAYRLGDAETVAEAAQLLSPYAHLPVMPSLAVVCLGSAERALGLSDAVHGRLDTAVGHLEAAVRADRRLANRPMALLTEHTLARVLLARRAAGDEGRAESLASRAAERAARMGIGLPGDPPWWASAMRGVGATRRAHQVVLGSCASGWRIEVDGRAAILANRVGFSYLTHLVGCPGQYHHVLDLVSSGALVVRAGPEPLLDAHAVRSYRRRADDLTRTLARTDLRPVAAKRARDELDALKAALRSATGLSGRVRAFPDDHERARTAVRKAIVRCVAAIAVVEPGLGHHLETSITTGATCRYAPSPEWKLTVRPPAHTSRISRASQSPWFDSDTAATHKGLKEAKAPSIAPPGAPYDRQNTSP